MSGLGYNELILGCYVLEPLVDYGAENEEVSSSRPSTTQRIGSAASRRDPYAQKPTVGHTDSANSAAHVSLQDMKSLKVPKFPNEAKLKVSSPRFEAL